MSHPDHPVSPVVMGSELRPNGNLEAGMLILTEGVPGAGKSSLARHLRDALSADGRPVRWWSEEELGHPVYVYRDDAELKQCIADLTAGRYNHVVLAADLASVCAARGEASSSRHIGQTERSP